MGRVVSQMTKIRVVISSRHVPCRSVALVCDTYRSFHSPSIHTCLALGDNAFMFVFAVSADISVFMWKIVHR